MGLSHYGVAPLLSGLASKLWPQCGIRLFFNCLCFRKGCK